MVSEQERRDQFLREFKALESRLIKISNLKDDYVSYSRAIHQIYYKRLNPVISDFDTFEFLKTAGDLRNILSHKNDVCSPSEVFMTEFHRISNAILNPVKSYDIATKSLSFCRLGDPLVRVLSTMDEQKLSHMPVLEDDGAVLGVFSRNSLFDQALSGRAMDHFDELTIRDFQDVIGFDSHRNETFVFVSRYRNAEELLPLMVKTKAHQKMVSVLFVTQNGSPKERLLGIITLTDLAKYSQDSGNV